MQLYRLTLNATVLVLTAATVHAQSACPTFVRRKEVRDLTSSEWSAYVAAVRQLNSGTQPSVWDRMSDLHNRYAATTHGGPQFFPWHRLYLYHYEWLLQRINPAVTVPYYDWSDPAFATNPEQSPILSNAYFGGNGRSSDQCVTTGQFANWRVAYPTAHCLRRSFSQGSSTGPFIAASVISAIVQQNMGYNDFRVAIESIPHGTVHVGIGGGSGDMNTMLSPNDPIFYSHHAMVDKIWSDWQKKSQTTQWAYAAAPGTASAALSNGLVGYDGWVVQDVMDHINTLCYDYVPRGRGTATLARRQDRNGTAIAIPAAKNRGSNNTATAKAPSSTNDPLIPFLEDIVSPPPATTGRAAAAIQLSNLDISDAMADAAAASSADYIRQPYPLPDAWATMNGISVAVVRAQEEGIKKIAAKINSSIRTRRGGAMG